MPLFRTLIIDFELANPAYVGGSVSFFTVDSAGVKTSTLATLYTGLTGAAEASNPQVLDGEGKFSAAVYHDVQVIASITGATAGAHDTGIISPHQGEAENLLINGDFRFASFETAFTSATSVVNNDDTVLLDRWVLLSDGNDVVDVNQLTDAALGNFSYLEADVETISKKFGFLQIVEQKDIINLLNADKTVSLSFKAKVSDAAKLDDIRCVVLSWDGTADAPTTDIISAWGAAGTVPTFITNWTAENTPVNLSVTASEALYTISGIDIDTSGVKNIGIFIWSDAVADNDTLGTKLHITDVQLEIGTGAPTFQRRPYEIEKTMVERFLEVIPQGIIGWGWVRNTTDMFLDRTFRTLKRVSPTITYRSGNTYNVFYRTVQAGATSVSTAGLKAHAVRFQSTGSSGLTAGEACQVTITNTPGAIYASAEF